ncbi:hypothetical protein AB205_0178270 [Aquarana catesbeiana]|uniref:MADF domain-containing protein n=1 Tax=Aquarana catesbeiana TaxID=8400 RepID=A0A2G9RIN1_AQUCT|nr:hypothetical protein AB205_0178270 [Aquarana catesbeiana]
MSTISTISTKDIFEAFNPLQDHEVRGFSLSSLLLSSTCTCCLSAMFSPTAPKEKGRGIDYKERQGRAEFHACAVYIKRNTCASYVRSVSRGRSNGSDDRYNEEKMDLFNDKDFIPIFIDMYRELPCLWQVNHPFYNNKPKRKAALDQLLEFLKPVIPTADIPYLKALIGGMRSTYNRKRKKVQDLLRSGAAADEIYVPRLWYYDRLHFLAGQTEPRPALSSLPSRLPSPPAEAYDDQPGPSRQQNVEEPSLSQV